MTLIVALGNADQVLLLADRRTTAGRTPRDEDHGKCGILECLDARMAFGFSGLATVGQFSTELWLLSSLAEAGPPDHFARPLLERLCDRATNEFQQNPILRHLSRREKRLTLMFCGYLYRADPALLACAFITNFQDFSTGVDSSNAWDVFRAIYQLEHRPLDHVPTVIHRIGAWPLVSETRAEPLRNLLSCRAHPKRILTAALDLLRKAAASPLAENAIGGRASAILLPRERSLEPESGYYTDVNTSGAYLPNRVVTVPGFGVAMAGAHISLRRSDGSPGVAETRAVKRNAPCPCGSDERYKNCHGKVRRRNL